MLYYIYYEIWQSKSLRIYHILIFFLIAVLCLLFKLSTIKGWYNSLIIIRPIIIFGGIAYPLLFIFPSLFKLVFYEKDTNIAYLCVPICIIIHLIQCKKDFFVEIRHLHFLNIDSSLPYILYLRSFDTDKKYTFRLRELEKFANNKRVYAIGNPKTLKQSLNSNFHIFYLPNTNWQKAVGNLSEKAEYIFINVGITEGVLWEIASHQQWSNKTIYCADSYEQLSSFIKKAIATDIIPKEFIESVIKTDYYQTHASSKNTMYFTVIKNYCLFVDSLSDFQILISRQ